ncbi:MAG: hypothetical protein KatS3mg082_2434 [Nitrospiraceae bacterium]|nr:MAG: hypothetical protein KatS3mg082_2434 [Nitrospiraceae bacterium]
MSMHAPYTPKTNGKAERFIQSSLRAWAYGRAYQTSGQRKQDLPRWLHHYNWHRPHARNKQKTTHQPIRPGHEQPHETPQLASSAPFAAWWRPTCRRCRPGSYTPQKPSSLGQARILTRCLLARILSFFSCRFQSTKRKHPKTGLACPRKCVITTSIADHGSRPNTGAQSRRDDGLLLGHANPIKRPRVPCLGCPPRQVSNILLWPIVSHCLSENIYDASHVPFGNGLFNFRQEDALAPSTECRFLSP